jgi:hypothetical protein
MRRTVALVKQDKDGVIYGPKLIDYYKNTRVFLYFDALENEEVAIGVSDQYKIYDFVSKLGNVPLIRTIRLRPEFKRFWFDMRLPPKNEIIRIKEQHPELFI